MATIDRKRRHGMNGHLAGGDGNVRNRWVKGGPIVIWLLVVAGVVAGLLLAIVLIGMLLPKGHTASRTASFSRPTEDVWQVISNFAAYPSWRKDLKAVELVADENDQPIW